MSGLEQLAALLRGTGHAGNSQDPQYYDEKAAILDDIAAKHPSCAADARLFASRARSRALELRAKRSRV